MTGLPAYVLLTLRLASLEAAGREPDRDLRDALDAAWCVMGPPERAYAARFCEELNGLEDALAGDSAPYEETPWKRPSKP